MTALAPLMSSERDDWNTPEIELEELRARVAAVPMTRDARLRALIGPLGWMRVEVHPEWTSGRRAYVARVEWRHQTEDDEGRLVRGCVGSVTAETMDEALERAIGHGGVA